MTIRVTQYNRNFWDARSNSHLSVTVASALPKVDWQIAGLLAVLRNLTKGKRRGDE